MFLRSLCPGEFGTAVTFTIAAGNWVSSSWSTSDPHLAVTIIAITNHYWCHIQYTCKAICFWFLEGAKVIELLTWIESPHCDCCDHHSSTFQAECITR